MPRRKRHAVVGAHRPGEPEVLERPLEDGKRELLLRRRQRLAGQQVAAREVGDGERIAVLPIAELELAFVVGTPEGIRFRRARERRTGGRGPAAAAPLDQAVAVEHRVDRTDRRQLHARDLLPELLPDLRRAPARVLALQPDDRRRQPIRLPIRPPTAIGERSDPAVFVPLEDLVPGLPRNAERGAQRRHLLAFEQAGHKPEPLVHDVTLLPRHAPSCEGAKVSPMCPEYGVTYLSGRTKCSMALGYRAFRFGNSSPRSLLIAVTRARGRSKTNDHR